MQGLTLDGQLADLDASLLSLLGRLEGASAAQRLAVSRCDDAERRLAAAEARLAEADQQLRGADSGRVQLAGTRLGASMH